MQLCTVPGRLQGNGQSVALDFWERVGMSLRLLVYTTESREAEDMIFGEVKLMAASSQVGSDLEEDYALDGS